MVENNPFGEERPACPECDHNVELLVMMLEGPALDVSRTDSKRLYQGQIRAKFICPQCHWALHGSITNMELCNDDGSIVGGVWQPST